MKKKFAIGSFVVLSILFNSSLTKGQLYNSQIVTETGMHVTSLARVATDPSGILIATGGRDLSIRVWDAITGRNIRTFYLPTSQYETETSIYSLAISPDRKKILAGGNIRSANERFYPIYIFDISSGYFQRIKGFEAPVRCIKFSPDGKFLCVGLENSEGIKIYETKDFKLICEDKSYNNSVYGVDFNEENLLATVSYDNRLRVYSFKSLSPFNTGKNDMSISPIASIYTKGMEPHSVAFYKNKGEIVVGYNQVNDIHVYEYRQRDLFYLHNISSEQIKNKSFSSIASSTDKTAIVAGGDWRSPKSGTILRKWNSLKSPRSKNVPARAIGNVTDVAALGNKEFAYVTDDPVVGILDADNKIVCHHKRNTIDFGQLETRNFFISKNGSSVCFKLDETNEYLGYSSSLGKLISYSKEDLGKMGFKNPIQQDPKIFDWENSLVPRYKNKSILLDFMETSKCLSIAENKKYFVIGTTKKIRLYDMKQGNLLREVLSNGGNIHAVNISSNGKILTAAYEDGTVRWYTLPKLKHILTFLLDINETKWVAWTPKGYYDASIGGDQLIVRTLAFSSDHLTQHVPCYKFSEVYYKPKVVRSVVQMKDEGRAYRKHSGEFQTTVSALHPFLMAVPQVYINNVENRALFRENEIPINLSIVTPDAYDATAIKVYIDGKLQEDQCETLSKPIKNGEKYTISVKLPSRDCFLSISAWNKHGESEPASLELFWDGKARTLERNLHVLVIGADRFQNSNLPKRKSSHYIDNFIEELSSINAKSFDKVRITTLTEENTTRQSVTESLLKLVSEVSVNDLAVILLSGRISVQENNEQGFLVRNFPKGDDEVLLSERSIQAHARKIKGQLIIFSDLRKHTNSYQKPDIVKFINSFTNQSTGGIIITDHGGRLIKNDDSSSPTLKAFINFLNKKNYNRQLEYISISLDDFMSYMRREVKNTSKNKKHRVIIATPRNNYAVNFHIKPSKFELSPLEND